MRQLSGSDAFFLYSDRPGRHQHVSTVYIYDPATAADGGVSFDAIRRHMEQRLDASRLFRQRLMRVPFDLDYPWWIEDPHFELDFHLRHIALPEPGDWRHLCIQLSRLHSRPLDLTRPPWEMYVIDGLDSVEGLPPGAFAVMTKVHHAAIDDVTEEDFTIALHDRGVSLEEVFGESDFVAVNCPLTDDTRGMIDGRLFSRIKPTAFFINTVLPVTMGRLEAIALGEPAAVEMPEEGYGGL